MTTKAAILKVIRAKCLDCSCYQPSEITKCTVQSCALYPFRFGKDPAPARSGNPESLRSAREVLGGAVPGDGT